MSLYIDPPKPRTPHAPNVTRRTVPDHLPARRSSSSAMPIMKSSGALLRAILSHGPIARSTAARLTGLSPATVTRHSAGLISLGLLRELPGEVQSNGVGRPHVPMDLDTSRHLVCAVHVAVGATTTALLDLRGRVLSQFRDLHPSPSGRADPRDVVRAAASRLTQQLAKHAAGRVPLGVGIATGGWVDRSTGTVVEHALLDWHNVPLRELMARQTGLRVEVDGHARALLHAERLFGAAQRAAGVLHLFIGNVVDAAFATEDFAHYGQRSIAGAVAHIPIAGSTELCPCGRTGCFQATVSQSTLVRRAVSEGVIREPDAMLLVQAAQDGDVRAQRMFVSRARLVGQAAAMLMNVFDPELTVVVEPGVAHLDEALDALRAEAAEHCVGGVTAASTIVPTSFPDTALAAAGGSVLLDRLYRDPAGMLGRRA